MIESSLIRFGPFELDPSQFRLKRTGRIVEIQAVPFQILALLASRPGQLISRDEIIREIWGSTHVDFDNSLNNAIARVRHLLGDSSSSPAYIETVARRGYRFIAETRSAGLPAPPAMHWPEHYVPAATPQAQAAYWRGRVLWERATPRHLRLAASSFQAAISHAPDFAPAWAWLANTYCMLGDNFIGGMNTRSALAKAEQAARHALRTNAACSDAHAALAMVHWRLDWDWPAAEREFQSAITLDPTNALAHQFYCWLLAAQGRSREAWVEILRARHLAPHSSFIRMNLGWTQYHERRYADAIATLEALRAGDPEFPLLYLPLGESLLRDGRLPEAIAILDEGVRVRRAGSICRGALGNALAMAGDSRAALRLLAARHKLTAFDRAMVQMALEQKQAMQSNLRVSAEENSTRLCYLCADPVFDPIRETSIFDELVTSVRAPFRRE